MDPIAAITSANSSSTSAADRAQQCSSQADMNNLQACANPAQPTPGANLTLTTPVQEPPAQMNVVSASHVLSDRIKNGFYMKDLNELIKMGNDPYVSIGEKATKLAEVQERIAMAKMAHKVAEKLAEGLQTVVTKSS
jgi:hypothetical protein